MKANDGPRARADKAFNAASRLLRFGPLTFSLIGIAKSLFALKNSLIFSARRQEEVQQLAAFPYEILELFSSVHGERHGVLFVVAQIFPIDSLLVGNCSRLETGRLLGHAALYMGGVAVRDGLNAGRTAIGLQETASKCLIRAIASEPTRGGV